MQEGREDSCERAGSVASASSPQVVALRGRASPPHSLSLGAISTVPSPLQSVRQDCCCGRHLMKHQIAFSAL